MINKASFYPFCLLIFSVSYHKTSNNSPLRLFVQWSKNSRHLIETQRLFVSCISGKILVPVTQGNYIMFT